MTGNVVLIEFNSYEAILNLEYKVRYLNDLLTGK